MRSETAAAINPLQLLREFLSHDGEHVCVTHDNPVADLLLEYEQGIARANNNYPGVRLGDLNRQAVPAPREIVMATDLRNLASDRQLHAFHSAHASGKVLLRYRRLPWSQKRGIFGNKLKDSVHIAKFGGCNPVGNEVTNG